ETFPGGAFRGIFPAPQLPPVLRVYRPQFHAVRFLPEKNHLFRRSKLLRVKNPHGACYRLLCEWLRVFPGSYFTPVPFLYFFLVIEHAAPESNRNRFDCIESAV